MLNIKRLKRKFNLNAEREIQQDDPKLLEVLSNGHLFSYLYQLWRVGYDISNKVVVIDENDVLELIFKKENRKDVESFINDLINSKSITFIVSVSNKTKVQTQENYLFINNFLNKHDERYFVFESKFLTSELLSTVISYIDRKNAQVSRLHGSLMSIYGEGVIIKGKSGIGKSELVLNLLKQNHLFVADDALDIIEYSGELFGKAAPFIKNFLEIRGIGIIDIKKALGIEVIINSTKISLIIELEYLEDVKADIDRLGNETTYEVIHNQEVPKIIIPVSQGRDLASIVEMAVIVHKMKKYDKYNFLDSFNELKAKNEE